jgi:hypothetical protein
VICMWMVHARTISKTFSANESFSCAMHTRTQLLHAALGSRLPHQCVSAAPHADHMFGLNRNGTYTLLNVAPCVLVSPSQPTKTTYCRLVCGTC